jgi:pyruvate dehydrogenase E2 component (dihydrolipoamide acetyltransferase)
MYNVDLFIPIINPPETAILGVGRVIEKPVAVDGQVTVKPAMQLSLAYDHRIVDGAPAAKFLQTIKQILEAEIPRE